MGLLVYGGRIADPLHSHAPDSWLIIEDGQIAQVGTGLVPGGDHERVDLAGSLLGPGLIDLHVHGAVGHDLMHVDAAALAEVSSFFASRGVTGFLACTYSSSVEGTLGSVTALASQVGSDLPGAQLLGVNIEGPFLSEARKGAHATEFIRDYDSDELAALLASGAVRIVTFAPEIEGSAELIDDLLRAGAVASVGHTDATAAQVREAADHGATLVTHTFNGMRGIHHREAGAVGAALLDDRLVCEVIADGFHIAPDVLPLFWRTKGADRIALVTDGGPAMGLPDGVGTFAGKPIRIEGGVTMSADGTISSSTRSLDHGVRTFAAANGIPLTAAWRCASLTPATVLGLDDRKGRVMPGFDADLVAMDDAGAVVLTIVAGRVVYRASDSE